MLNLMKTNLKNSPIYNLSISSLENFYTSFLNWMGQEYPRELLKILTGKEFSKEAKIAFETQVQYGKNIKLDLQIKIKDGDNIEYVVAWWYVLAFIIVCYRALIVASNRYD